MQHDSSSSTFNLQSMQHFVEKVTHKTNNLRIAGQCTTRCTLNQSSLSCKRSICSCGCPTYRICTHSLRIPSWPESRLCCSDYQIYYCFDHGCCKYCSSSCGRQWNAPPQKPMLLFNDSTASSLPLLMLRKLARN